MTQEAFVFPWWEMTMSELWWTDKKLYTKKGMNNEKEIVITHDEGHESILMCFTLSNFLESFVGKTLN